MWGRDLRMWGRAGMWGSPPTHGCHVLQALQAGPQRPVLIHSEGWE